MPAHSFAAHDGTEATDAAETRFRAAAREPVVSRLRTRAARLPEAASKLTSSVPSVTWSPTATWQAWSRPAAGATIVCSIFIASSTSSGAPRRISRPDLGEQG